MDDQIRAILFDLDGTLLDNDMHEFLPHYFHKLSARVAHLIPPDEFMDCLMRATDAMLANDGQATNEEVFARVFYSLVGVAREEMESTLLEFYAVDFPLLKKYTRRKPEAPGVVQQAFDLGCDVVVATNPLFPATAVEQRMEWAGVAGFPYQLVTSYENCRAAKPSLLYFAADLGGFGLSCRFGPGRWRRGHGHGGGAPWLPDLSGTRIPHRAGSYHAGTRLPWLAG